MLRWLHVVLVLLLPAALLANPLPMSKQQIATSDPALQSAKSAPVAPFTSERSTHLRGTLDEILLEEDFEAGTMPPAGWARIVYNTHAPTYTWHSAVADPFEGVYNAQVLYAEDLSLQDEWLVSPALNLAAASGDVSVHFAWNSSYYWGVSPYDNYDLELRISTDGGTTWAPTVLWVEDNEGTFSNYVWYEEDVSLAAYNTQSNVKIAFRYHGTDGAQAGVDAIVIATSAPSGAIAGTVTDSVTTNPLPGATIAIQGTALSTTSGMDGTYEFASVPPGTYTLTCTKAGYYPKTVTGVSVTEGATTTVNIAMASTGANVVIDENFDALSAGELPQDWFQVDVDGGTSPVFSGPSQWQVISSAGFGHSGNNVVGNAYNGDGSANNDWLILPQQLLGAPITLSYWASSQDPDWLESYEIRVSTTGTQPANFTNLIASFTDHPGPWTEHTHDLSAFANQPFYIAFHYNSTDEFILKIDDVVLEGAEPSASEELPTLAREFAFHGNYPNPFNAQTQFSFALDRAGDVRLTLFNIAGQEVAQVVNAAMSAGAHVVPFDANALPSGLYFAHLTANQHSATHKVMLLK